MPAQKKTGGLMAKLGKELKTAHDNAKGQQTEYSKFSDLPAGINGGVAKLIDIGFRQFKEGDMKGQYYFFAVGAVVKPREFEDQVIYGLQTRLSNEPICATPSRTRKTIKEHIEWVYNELRKLGVDTNDIDPDNLEAVCEALKENPVYFKFRTWKGKVATEGQYKGQEPRTNHEWSGVIPDFQEDGEGLPDVNVNTDDEPGDEGSGDGDATPADDAPADENPGEQVDLDDLATRADKKKPDEEAIVQLKELALSLDIPEEEIDNADNWTAVADMIREKQGGEGGEGDDAPADDTPKLEKEVVVKYSPRGKDGKVQVNPKTKKKVVIECEITAVNDKKKTLTLKNLEDGRTVYKDIGFDDVTVAE